MCDTCTLTVPVPIPPPAVTSLTPPSPKLNVTLLIDIFAPAATFPLAVKVRDNGASPVVDLSTTKLLHTGACVVVPGPPGPVVGAAVGILVGEGSGVGTASVGVTSDVGNAVGLGIGSGVPDSDDAPPITIVAGVALDKTFSLA